MAPKHGLATHSSGPWSGVQQTTDPTDDTPDKLTLLTNGYIPDPVGRSGVYGRPGCARPTSVPTGGNPQAGMWSYIGLDGTNYNFLAVNGKIWRFSTNLASPPVDVTPANITVSPNRFVFFQTFNNVLIVSDGVNQPWYGTNLSATPITGTLINYNSPATILSLGGTNTAVASAAFTYTILGVPYSKAVVSAGTALAAGTIPLNTWGIYRFSINSAGTITSTAGAANFGAGYATEALAIAALPALPAASADMGYVTVKTKVGSSFIGGTDALAGGIGGNVASATNYSAGGNPSWVAFGQPEVYAGSLFFMLTSVAGVTARTTITWSEVNDQTLGYQQTNYDNSWTLTQTGVTPIFALKGTNTALYYARDLSWGAITGSPGVAFRSTATHDVISVNVGCVACQTAVLFGNYVYFNDNVGRTWRFAVGTTAGCEPLWLQARAAYETAAAAGLAVPANIAAYTWAVIEPNLNLYITGAWPSGAGDNAPTTAYIYEARSGRYMGTWTIGGGIAIDYAAPCRDTNNQPVVFFLQANAGGTGYLWRLSRLSDNVWQDNSATVPVVVQTQRLGFSLRDERFYTRVRASVGDTTPVALTTLTPYVSTVQPTVTPPTSVSGTTRLEWTLNSERGTGIQLSFSPATTTAQWQLYVVEVDAETSQAGIEAR